MKKILTLFILAVLVVSVSAQSREGSNDPDATKFLKEVTAGFKKIPQLQSDFTLTVHDSGGKLISTEKGAVFMKGNKYRVQYGIAQGQKPKQEIFSDSKAVWSFDRDANEVIISLPDESSGSITPQKLFTNFYEKDFLYKLNGEKKAGNKTLVEIEMTPTDKTLAYHKVYLLFDKQTKFLQQAKLLDKSGYTFTYDVNKTDTKNAIADSKLVFNKADYPGVEILDFR